MLGWHIGKAKDADYSLPLPPLSDDEEVLVEEVSEELKNCAKHREITSTESKEIIAQLLRDYCTANRISLDKKQQKYLAEYIRLNVIGLCGLDLLLADGGIEEIALIGLGKPVYVYLTKSGWARTNLFFDSEELAIDVINKIARSLGRRITYQCPKLNATLSDGSRLHASIPPISGVELTIRKFRSVPISVAELVASGTYTSEALAYLSLIFQADCSVIIAGNTASGKTSTLNALFAFVPVSERILIIEETPEIVIPHQHIVKMVANPDLGIGMRDLVEDSLRMRPDRVIVGEVRTKEEVHALIETILSGQARGSYATFHAQSADEVLKRFVSFGIMPIDLASIDVIVVQRRLLRYDAQTKACWEERRAIEIAEILPGEAGLNYIFKYDHKHGVLRGTIKDSQKLDQISAAFRLSRDEISAEVAKRAALIDRLAAQGADFFYVTKEIQRELFGLETAPLPAPRAASFV